MPKSKNSVQRGYAALRQSAQRSPENESDADCPCSPLGDRSNRAGRKRPRDDGEEATTSGKSCSAKSRSASGRDPTPGERCTGSCCLDADTFLPKPTTAAPTPPRGERIDPRTFKFSTSDLPGFKRMYDWLLYEMKLVEYYDPDRSTRAPGHVPLSVIFQDVKVKNAVYAILSNSTLGAGSSFKIWSRGLCNALFSSLGVEMEWFRKDFEAFWKKWMGGKEAGEKQRKQSFFITSLFVYTMRYKQCACAKCGREIASKIFGALAHESNHFLVDIGIEGQPKLFGLDCGNFDKPFLVVLFELAKTRLECSNCHNRVVAWGDMELTECHGEYDFEPRAFCDVQESSECKALYDCIVDLQRMDLNSLSRADVRAALEAVQAKTKLHPLDLMTFSEKRWNESCASSRFYLLFGVYYKGEKRLAGGCLKCGKRISDLCTQAQQNQDGHHVLPYAKKFNPSDWRGKSLEESRLEWRKTVPLCKMCHAEVTHDDDEELKLRKMIEDAGLLIDEETGEIYRE